MPQFEMPIGDNAKGYAALSYIAQGYVEALFFTECTSDNKELEHMTFDDIAPETLARIVDVCDAFEAHNAVDIAQAVQMQERNGYDEKRVGNDLWFTRNGHGTGFWDRDLGEVGERLTNEAKRLGEVYAFYGNDYKLHLS